MQELLATQARELAELREDQDRELVEMQQRGEQRRLEMERRFQTRWSRLTWRWVVEMAVRRARAAAQEEKGKGSGSKNENENENETSSPDRSKADVKGGPNDEILEPADQNEKRDDANGSSSSINKVEAPPSEKDQPDEQYIEKRNLPEAPQPRVILPYDNRDAVELEGVEVHEVA